MIGFSQVVIAHEPQTGWWWNASQSGRGYAIEKQGDKIFFAAYLYSDSGSATWVSAVLTQESEDRFTGKLEEFANGQTLLGDYHQPDKVNDNVGDIILDFPEEDEGILTWPGGVVSLTHFRFGGDSNKPDDNDNS